MYLNRATLIGYLGGDAEIRTGKNNQKFTTFSIATKTSYKDKESGEYISHTEWHRCIVFGKFGEFAATLKKGAHLQVEGEIRHTEYTPKKAKKPVRTDSIRVNSILKLDRAEKAAAEEQEVEQEIPSEEAAAHGESPANVGLSHWKRPVELRSSEVHHEPDCRQLSLPLLCTVRDDCALAAPGRCSPATAACGHARTSSCAALYGMAHL
jgi:single-strand DNA-binding protein